MDNIERVWLILIIFISVASMCFVYLIWTDCRDLKKFMRVVPKSTVPRSREEVWVEINIDLYKQSNPVAEVRVQPGKSNLRTQSKYVVQSDVSFQSNPLVGDVPQ